jgi:hypothetical protein
LENTEENCEILGKIWKKNKLNSEDMKNAEEKWVEL